MRQFFQLLILLPLLVICYQIYRFTSSSQGEEKQSRCKRLGIGYMVLGILALTWRDPLFAFFGLILIMFGFRLMAKSLDRINKTIFIESYNDEEKR